MKSDLLGVGRGKTKAYSLFKPMNEKIIVDFECRRCGGRGRLPKDKKDCYICLGKKRIRLTEREVVDHFRRFGAG